MNKKMNNNNILAINAKTCSVLKNADDSLMLDPDGLLQIYNKITDEVVGVDLNEYIIELFNLTEYISDNQKIDIPSDKINTFKDVDTEDEFIDEEYLEEEYQNDADGYNKCDELQNVESSTSQPSTSSEQLFEKKARWSNSADLALISLFSDNKSDFFGTKIRKMAVWHKISAELADRGHKYTARQCSGRFCRLDMKYHTKKDNMRNKSSGAEAISFKYYNEFEDIFGKKPNIDPKYSISSRRQVPKTSTVTSSTFTAVSTTSQGQNLSRSSSQLTPTPTHEQVSQLKEQNVTVLSSPVTKLSAKKRVTPADIFQRDVNKEAGREKRHQEKLELKRQAATQLTRMADILEKRLSK